MQNSLGQLRVQSEENLAAFVQEVLRLERRELLAVPGAQREYFVVGWRQVDQEEAGEDQNLSVGQRLQSEAVVRQREVKDLLRVVGVLLALGLQKGQDVYHDKFGVEMRRSVAAVVGVWSFGSELGLLHALQGLQLLVHGVVGAAVNDAVQEQHETLLLVYGKAELHYIREAELPRKVDLDCGTQHIAALELPGVAEVGVDVELQFLLVLVLADLREVVPVLGHHQHVLVHQIAYELFVDSQNGGSILLRSADEHIARHLVF